MIWDGHMMIKMSLFTGVRDIHFDRLWNCISKAGHVVFPLFPLKPVIMMSPTCQPDDGWIAKKCTVTFIIHNRDNLVPARNISRNSDVLWKNKGMWDARMTHPVNNEIHLSSLGLPVQSKCNNKPITFTFCEKRLVLCQNLISQLNPNKSSVNPSEQLHCSITQPVNSSSPH